MSRLIGEPRVYRLLIYVCVSMAGVAFMFPIRAQAQRGKQPNRRSRPGGRARLGPLKLPEGVKMEKGIVYGKAGKEGRDLRLDLFLPRAIRGTELRPGVVFIHGGGWRGGSPAQFHRQSAYLASKGFVCVSIEYRLSQEGKFPAALRDAKCAVRWMRANADKYKLDAERVAAAGGSAGGHLAAMLGVTARQKEFEGEGGNEGFASHVNACVIFNGVLDMRRVGPKQPVMDFLGGAEDKMPDIYSKASPITHVSNDCPPFLLLHGTEDRTVPIQQARAFAAKLKDLGCRVELAEYQGAQHGFFNGGAYYEQTLKRMEEFLVDLFATSGDAK